MRLAPGVPSDYYDSIDAIEEHHWWYRGMRAITAALLAERLSRRSQRLLDAGCGTGGFLRWALDLDAFAEASGVDLSPAAIDLASRRVPEATLAVASLHRLPFPESAFDLVVASDVLQHVPEAEVHGSLRELSRVLRPGGALLVRTNGARRARRERDDWRVYDAGSLSEVLTEAGFRCERVTHANLAGSLLAIARGRAPRPPTEHTHGVPSAEPSMAGAIAYRLLLAEARYLRRHSRSLPYGHTLFALAVPES
jgi:SAM-dependent methyltransferase